MSVQEHTYHTQPSIKAHKASKDMPLTEGSVEGHIQKQKIASIYVKDSAAPGLESQAIRSLSEQAGVLAAELTHNNPGLFEVQYDPQHTRGNQILRTLRGPGYERTCIALMYFKGSDAADFETKMVGAVTSQSGVIAAERSAHKAYVMMVHFDPRQTTGSHIVNALKKEGYAALLVGC